MKNFFRELGGISLFTWETLRLFATTSGSGPAIFKQVAFISYRSLSTIAFAGLFVGAILVLQFNLILGKFDAQIYLGGLNSSGVIREIGPLIISFLLAGKIGAYTAAELGTMRVTEQIEAIECLGVRSMRYLVLPRFMGIVLSGLVLLVIGVLVSILGSMLVAQAFCGINFLQFLSSVPVFVSWGTVFGGVFKAFVYSFIVAAVCCYKGYTASGGARGVGRAVNEASIYTNLYIVIATYLTTELIDVLRLVIRSLSEVDGT